LILEPWTPESDLLTPTLKMKRALATKFYEEDITTLYGLPVLKVEKK